MTKLSVVYKAPPGENKVLEAFGHTFFDGKPEEIEVTDETAEKIKKHGMFHPAGKQPEPDKHTDKHK